MSAEAMRLMRENLKKLGLNEENIKSILDDYVRNHDWDIDELLELTNNFKELNAKYKELSGKNEIDEWNVVNNLVN